MSDRPASASTRAPTHRPTTRCAIVGTGARAGRYARALAVDHADTCELVALADVKPVRMDAHNRQLAERCGARSLLTGLAANASPERGQPVRVADLLDQGES